MTELRDAILLADEVERQAARIVELEAGLHESITEWRYSLPYAPEYFREKYDYDATADRIGKLVGLSTREE
jgi:hypothetical protein